MYCELYSCLVTADVLRPKKIVGIILSGGPSSVYDEGAPHVDASVWALIDELKVPVLGICYGMQEICWHYGGEVASGEKREFGKATAVPIAEGEGEGDALLKGLEGGFQVWMSHSDKVVKLPDGFTALAKTDNSEYVAVACPAKKLYALQFHPEVTHSPRGTELLSNFVIGICGAAADWTMSELAETFIAEARAMVGPTGHVIGAVSGGVDSSVAAVLLHRAIGDRFHAVMVDSGCLRKDEAAQTVERLNSHLGINLKCIDGSALFLGKLKGVSDPEKKRKIIGGAFIEIFQEEALKLGGEHECTHLLQGTLYPDVIESVSYKGPSATIKTHHNVGGLPPGMKLKVGAPRGVGAAAATTTTPLRLTRPPLSQLIEPLRELFKDEVRALGMVLGIDEISVWRHPFPGPGLAIRVLGEVTKERCDILREADAIAIEEIIKAGLYRKIGQAFVVLLPVKSVGVMGDGRTYENVCALRCAETTDYMTADFYHVPFEVLGAISSRIINEVRGINRVCYDISSKPPATIEWE